MTSSLAVQRCCPGALLQRRRMRCSHGGALLQVWCAAIPLYAVMPAGIEWAAEQGLTRAYSRYEAGTTALQRRAD